MSYNQATLGTCPRSSGDRASASGAESHRFESCRGHHTFTRCARTQVLSRIYLSLYSIYSFPCCVFTLFCIVSSVLCAAYLLFSAQHLLSPYMCKKYVLHVSQHTAHIVSIMVPYWLQRYTAINTLILPTQRRLRLTSGALRLCWRRRAL